MKKILIMCGTGIATSTIVTEKVKAWLKDMNLNHNVVLYQAKISDELGRLNEYDIIVSTTMVPKSVKEIVIDGVPRSEEHTSELQSRGHLVCRLLLEKKNKEANK